MQYRPHLAQLADNLALCLKMHGKVRGLPVAHDAQALELLGLLFHPARSELATLTTELDHIDLVLVLTRVAVTLLDLPFNRQAVTVPARDIVRVLALHLLGAVDGVFKDFIQRVTNVKVTICVGRAIMQHELLAPSAGLANLSEQIHFFPLGLNLRLANSQIAPHWEIGLWQGHGVAVLISRRIVSHGAVLNLCLE